MSTPLQPNADEVHHVFTVVTPGGEREIDAYTEEGFQVLSHLWTRSGWQRRISYEVTWLGIPVIQLPQDITMMHELLWRLRPDVVIESGVAHGGALVLYASVLELLGKGRVIGVDIEIRKYNRLAIESHPLSHRITLIEGSSVDDEVVASVARLIQPAERVLVALDSNHSRAHVRNELERYAPFVSPGSYMVVFDGVMPMVHDAPGGSSEWSHDNPNTAAAEFLEAHSEFEVDSKYTRLGATYCPGGFLLRRPNARPSLGYDLLRDDSELGSEE